MTELLTAAQMRMLEQAAIDSGRVTGLELMERAGRAVVEAIFDEWPALRAAPRRAVVLCGPGNNGGDGFVIARLLRDVGWDVVVFLFGDPERLPPDAKSNYLRWTEMGDVFPMTEGEERDTLLFDPRPDLWIDAIFGIGQTRPLPGPVSDILHRISNKQASPAVPVVAVDFPSGLASDTGESLQGACLSADLTVTFHGPKLGHTVGDGPMRSGKVVIADIGL